MLLVQVESSNEETRFKIIEFWKKKAPDTDVSRYFEEGYLPFIFLRRIKDGQQIVVYFFLPSSSWDDPSNLSFGHGVIDEKITFNQFHESKPKQEFSMAEFKQLLANDQEPLVPKVPFCRAK